MPGLPTTGPQPSRWLEEELSIETVGDSFDILHFSRSYICSTPRWLYRLILTIDANFRLKCKDKNNKNDVSLGDGWGHWVPQGEYTEYLSKHSHHTEVSCPFRPFYPMKIPNATSSSPTCADLNCEQLITRM